MSSVFFYPVSELEYQLKCLNRSIAVVLLLRFGQFFILNQARCLLLVIVALFAVGPAAVYPADRPDVVRILCKQFGKVRNIAWEPDAACSIGDGLYVLFSFMVILLFILVFMYSQATS